MSRDRPVPFGRSWWPRRRTPVALLLAALVALAIFSLISGLSVAPAAEAVPPALWGAGLLMASHVVSALLTTRISESMLPERRKAHLLTAACCLVMAGQVGALVLPKQGEYRFRLESNTTIAFGDAAMSNERAAPPPSSATDSASGPQQVVASSLVLAWIGLPVLFLFAWFAGLTAVPSFHALLRQREAERLRAAEAAQRDAELKLSVLAAQVEPHFLFNTLAGVRGAVASEPARAVVMIDRLAEYLRLTIPRLRDDGRSHQGRLQAQFEIAAAYLALMQARLPRLHYRIELPPALQAAQCPPLMLISLVENAVKHGVEPKAGPATITLTARRRPPPPGQAAAAASHAPDESIEVCVSDDRVGFRHGCGGGVGLTNIRVRLEQLYGGAAGLSLQERAGGGAQAPLIAC
jgi:signal transduction histidine kinase